jgi:hypothetical protein
MSHGVGPAGGRGIGAQVVLVVRGAGLTTANIALMAGAFTGLPRAFTALAVLPAAMLPARRASQGAGAGSA